MKFFFLTNTEMGWGRWVAVSLMLFFAVANAVGAYALDANVVLQLWEATRSSGLGNAGWFLRVWGRPAKKKFKANCQQVNFLTSYYTLY